MSELEDMLGKILSSPEEMGKINRLASELLGGGETRSEKSNEPDIGRLLGGLMKSGQSGGNKEALVAALGPYLKPERRRKLERALKISRLAGIAGIAINEWGDSDV